MKLGTVISCVWAAATGLCCATGCTGVNSSGSVSPASFLLPGLIQRSPAQPEVVPEGVPGPLGPVAPKPLLASSR